MAPYFTRARRAELVRGAIAILKDHPEGVPCAEVIARMRKQYPPTEVEQVFPSERNRDRYQGRIEYEVTNASTAPSCLGDEGWVIKANPRWYLTDRGRQALRDFPDAIDFLDEIEQLRRRRT